MNYDKTCQLLIIGDSSVGKTSLITRYTNGTFKEEYLATVGLDYHTKIEDINNQTIQIKLWDTAGQERFKSLTQNLFRNAEGVLLVFDVSKNETFYNLKDWIASIKKNIESQNMFIPLVILGNKIDLGGREVSTEDAENFANENKYKYFETSAKTGEGVDNAIRELVSMVISQNNQNDYQKQARINSVQIKKDDIEKTNEKKKGCC
jgi:small GTP-binding protein